MKIPTRHIQRLTTGQFRPGMFLVNVDRCRLDMGFSFQKRFLKSPELIEHLRQSEVRAVRIDVSREAGPLANDRTVIPEPGLHQGTFRSLELAEPSCDSHTDIVGHLNSDKETIDLAGFSDCGEHPMEMESYFVVD